MTELETNLIFETENTDRPTTRSNEVERESERGLVVKGKAGFKLLYVAHFSVIRYCEWLHGICRPNRLGRCIGVHEASSPGMVPFDVHA